MEAYNAPLKSTNNVEQLEQLLTLFSTYKSLREGGSKLRPQLVYLLALYFIYGVNKEAKKIAIEVLGVQDSHIASMNFELREKGYMKKDPYNQRINHLHPHLEKLRDYYKSLEGKPVLFMFNLALDA